jgi:hypothetical protein
MEEGVNMEDYNFVFPLSKDDKNMLIELVADIMTYEKTVSYMQETGEMHDDDNGDKTSPLDRFVWLVRNAYIDGFAIGLLLFDDISEVENFTGIQITPELTDDAFQAAAQYVADYLEVLNLKNPKPQKKYEIISTKNEWLDPLEKLVAYESSGYDPQDIPRKKDSRRTELLIDPEDSGIKTNIKDMKLLAEVQELLKMEYDKGYIAGKIDNGISKINDFFNKGKLEE